MVSGCIDLGLLTTMVYQFNLSFSLYKLPSTALAIFLTRDEVDDILVFFVDVFVDVLVNLTFNVTLYQQKNMPAVITDEKYLRLLNAGLQINAWLK